jgi:hypothetical protein
MPFFQQVLITVLAALPLMPSFCVLPSVSKATALPMCDSRMGRSQEKPPEVPNKTDPSRAPRGLILLSPSHTCTKES